MGDGFQRTEHPKKGEPWPEKEAAAPAYPPVCRNCGGRTEFWQRGVTNTEFWTCVGCGVTTAVAVTA